MHWIEWECMWFPLPVSLEKAMATHSSILAWRIPMDRGAWWATVHGVAKNWPWLRTSLSLFSQTACLFHYLSLDKNLVLGKQNSYLLLFSSVQSLSRVRLFATPWTAACQAFLSITNSRSSPKPMSIELVMPSNHLILCHPLLLLPSIFPSIRVFSNELALHIRWPKYWSFSFNISPWMNTQDWSPSGWTGWISLQSKGLSRV